MRGDDLLGPFTQCRDPFGHVDLFRFAGNDERVL